ncbi:hypothetical protein RHSIM_RhsimUnG0045000 [Rhododendron simsii]|uniref:Peroxin-12 n=1 Tax=Rhododendron simsii TaxID=118357 RepID=A0A834L5J6_RHOSS|nr:hypothetical protein RHSIM_RhsimUnG0045000 [Rhododendron simsii]
MAAAQQLPSSLRAALTYSLGGCIIADASFAESLYGLRRRAVNIKVKKDNTRSDSGLSFAYQLLYLLDATGFYSPGLHALGIHVCRATGQELMDTSSKISKIRSSERERLRGPPWLKAVQGALLSCTYTVLDYAQTGLIAAVFFFKIAKEGIPLPPDRAMCPLCSQKRANPSVLAVSGFVFCYACIFKYVSQYKRCPVTLLNATVDQIRRLFHDV